MSGSLGNDWEQVLEAFKSSSYVEKEQRRVERRAFTNYPPCPGAPD